MNGEGPVERFFGAHAQGYSKSQSHARGADLASLVGALHPRSTETALDVATGTGFTAVALARLVRKVTGIDVTREMLEEAKRLAKDEAVTNIEFTVGDALKTGFPDSSFDIVATRRAAHHFADVPRFLHEAKRVLRPGGRLGVADMSPPAGAEEFSNEIERLRDGSHNEAFAPGTWRRMVSEAGLQVVSSQVLAEAVSFKRWLYPVKMGGEEEQAIRLAWGGSSLRERELLGADLNGGAIRGWNNFRIVLVATKR